MAVTRRCCLSRWGRRYDADWGDWIDQETSGNSIPPALQAQTYQRPKVETNDRSICNPSIVGQGAKGGTITTYGGEQQFDVVRGAWRRRRRRRRRRRACLRSRSNRSAC